MFIKSVTGKNRTGNRGRKRDLEKGFNDIDKLLENMDNVGTERNVNSENMEVIEEKENKEINYMEIKDNDKMINDTSERRASYR